MDKIKREFNYTIHELANNYIAKWAKEYYIIYDSSGNDLTIQNKTRIASWNGDSQYNYEGLKEKYLKGHFKLIKLREDSLNDLIKKFRELL